MLPAVAAAAFTKADTGWHTHWRVLFTVVPSERVTVPVDVIWAQLLLGVFSSTFTLTCPVAPFSKRNAGRVAVALTAFTFHGADQSQLFCEWSACSSPVSASSMQCEPIRLRALILSDV